MLQKFAGDAGFRVKQMVFFTPEEKTMQVTDAQRTYMITNTATRLFLRSPKTSSETFTQDVSSALCSPGPAERSPLCLQLVSCCLLN